MTRAESSEIPDLMGRVAPERQCLEMQGADARAVLQGVVTNDVGRLSPEKAVYAALLTPQGKYLFDFFLVDAGEGRILIDAAAEQAEALARRIKMYCLRRDARVEMAPDIAVGLAWPGGRGPDPLPSGQDVKVMADPRMEALGWRIYCADPAATLQAMGIAPATEADWTALRIHHQVPETGVELVPDETFILEAGFERLHGVDFKKGCYVGQEVTARMKHKTALRKGLVQVEVTGTAPPGTPVETAEEKPAGVLFSQAGGRGLAHLRFDRAEGALRAGAAQVRMLGTPFPE